MDKLKIFKDILCIFLAIIIALILVNLAVTVPTCEQIALCEESLSNYLENPIDYKPKENIEITLKNNIVTATIPGIFMLTEATLLENGEYVIETTVKNFSIFSERILLFLVFSSGMYLVLNVLFKIFSALFLKLFKILKKFFNFLFKKVKKFFENLDSQRKKKAANKDFEDPKLKEAYDLGYNVGMADGIAKGKEIASHNLNTYSQHP